MKKRLIDLIRKRKEETSVVRYKIRLTTEQHLSIFNDDFEKHIRL